MADNEKSTRNIKNRDSSNTSTGQAQLVVEDIESQSENEKDEQIGDEEQDGNLPSPPLPVKTGNSTNLGPGTASANQGTRNQRHRSSSALANCNITGNSGSSNSNSGNGSHNSPSSSANGAYFQDSANQGNSTKARNQAPMRRRQNYDTDQEGVVEDAESEYEGAFGGDVGLYAPMQGGGTSDNGVGINLVDNNFEMRSLQPGSVPYNWQATKKTLRERLSYIFNSESMADVHFVVGKGSQPQRIPAHKFVLSIGSAVFDAMFNGGMATTSDEVELPDVEPSAFLAVLRFLYTDEVHIGPETVMTSLYTAKKYAVPALEKACVDFLKRNLSSDNAFMLLTQARLFDEPQLAALCLETIDKNTKEAISAEGFTDIDLDTMCVVLERDTLGIRECKVFTAVCRWAEAECLRKNLVVTSENKRQVLGRALELIRFPLMTVEEFAMGAAQSGILLDREVVQLFLHFTVNPKPAVMFLDTPRCCLTGKEQVVSRFCQIESRWGYSGTSDRIRLVVNRRIFVVGFGLYGSIHGPSEYNVNIQVIHTDSGKTCGQNDATFQCDGSTSTFRVMFKEPVELQPNTSYTACATLKGPDSYYGTKGLRKVTHESLTSGKVTFQFTYAAGNNNGTSVEDGQLPEIIFYT